jgi:biopolymer transport protein TolR
MSFSMAGRGARGPEMNVTPLIDVLLTLIIVFMVVVSMDKEQGETAQIPQPDQKQTQSIAQPRTVVIQVVWTKENQPPP